MNKKTILLYLNHHGLTLGAVESLTGGMFASSAVDIPGASATFRGAIVTYAIEVKVKLAGVAPETIENYGVVSSLSFTGNAGPGVQDSRPVGDVYIALTIKDECIVEHHLFEGTRMEIRKACVNKGWELLERVIKERKENYL
jgi:nicotinamide mononucleotide (NMN) deamidase PncC